MHLDVLAARRTQAGEPVVHGIHALLWALDAAAAAGLPVAGMGQIKAQFTNFIALDREVSARVPRDDASGLRIALFVGDLEAMTVVLRPGAPRPREFAERLGLVESQAGPAALSFDQMRQCAGWLRSPVPDQDFAAAFPHAAAAMTPRRLSGLAQTSRLVGMVCPGLHSIYAGLALDLTDGFEPDDGIRYRVAKADERFRLLALTVWGDGLSGKISAYARQPPVAAPAMADIARQVAPGEFAGVTALVAGGSRGLGAVTAKIIAAGGGRVAITYATGRHDAEAVCQDIVEACGADACRVLAYDASRAASPQLAGVAGWASALYFFATTPIFAAKTGVFDPLRLAQFTRVYVEGFHDCCQTMRHDGLSVFYPSSVAVEHRPAGMLEYAMAKMAGEMLCAELRTRWDLSITISRLPRVLTDQTATVARADSADATEIMLPLVRAMRIAHRIKP